MNKITIGNAEIYAGNNLEILPTLADHSIDSIVTDPPYELGFMGKSWDSSGIAYNVELWRECLRVLKPGGHLLAFGGTRTFHRIAVAIEDAGFEIRDNIAWLYGSGFPKSHNISLAIDKAAGLQEHRGSAINVSGKGERNDIKTSVSSLNGKLKPAYSEAKSFEAKQWEGWGTALKPAHEPIIVARKPLIGTVAANLLEHGVGGLNIGGSRIGTTIETWPSSRNYSAKEMSRPGSTNAVDAQTQSTGPAPAGRWPANIILDEYTAELLDEQSDASRFFYVAKASKRDRNEGLDKLEVKRPDERTSTGMGTFEEKGVQPQRNFHPTVKPTALMQYLIKLVTPAGGLVLDPFCGSGSTGKAALLANYQFIGIEITADYLPIIEGRLKHATESKNLF